MTPRTDFVAAWDLGRARRAAVRAWVPGAERPEYPSIDLGGLAGDFFAAGERGEPLPRWVRARRIGAIPPAGRSFNFREQEFEHGVSALALIGEPGPQADGTYALFNPGREIEITGWLIARTGSDGEPLLIGAREAAR